MILEETKQPNSLDASQQLACWTEGKSERQIIKEAIAKAFKVVARSSEVDLYSKPGPINIAEIMEELKLKPSSDPLPAEVITDIVHAKFRQPKKQQTLEEVHEEMWGPKETWANMPPLKPVESVKKRKLSL